MSIQVGLHNVSKITAEVEHGSTSHWIELKFEFAPIFCKEPPSTITVFFNDGHTADLFAAAVNSVALATDRPRVAANTAELMQQLRDSVALCDAESVP